MLYHTIRELGLSEQLMKTGLTYKEYKEFEDESNVTEYCTKCDKVSPKIFFLVT